MTTDPAEVIAGALCNPPPWPDRPPDPGPGGVPVLNGPEMLWQYRTPMHMPGGPALARHLAGGVLKALTDAGLIVVAAAGTLPTAIQVRRWLVVHGWKGSLSGGVSGRLWTPPGGGPPVGVPYDDDPDLIAFVIRRVAKRTGQPEDQITQEMLLCDNAG